jgi:hypothetical protein
MALQSRKCAGVEIVLDKSITNHYVADLKILSNCASDARKNDRLNVIDVN